MLNLGRASHDSAPHTDWDGYPTATMPWWAMATWAGGFQPRFLSEIIHQSSSACHGCQEGCIAHEPPV